MKAQKYLESPFAKHWMKEMQYTERFDDDGNKYVFLAILAGYKKISNEAFHKLCESIYDANYDDYFSMHMWMGGAVNWTMLYDQPFSHVNGRETFFCHGVGKDNYSPDNFDRDIEIVRNINGKATQEAYISYIFSKAK